MEKLERKICGLLVLILIISQLFILTQDTSTMSQTPELPRVSIVKLWSITHTAYMAKFIGEEYIVICTSHCDVSLDSRFISTYATAYIYDVVSGVLLGSLSGPGTWLIYTYKPFNAIKKSSLSGFFSADSKKMIVNPRYHGGTAVGVNDTSTWRTIPVEWGFTAPGDRFYATQLDYDGKTLAVGYIGVTWNASGWNDTSKLLVYRYDPSVDKYKLIYSSEENFGDYGRRLQMTLDGEVILVGGIGVTRLDIYVWNGTGYTVRKYSIPDYITALGISDPYNVGYVIIGTLNGWVIIGKYDREKDVFTIIYQGKLTPDNSWLYNPFYDRWIPSVTEVFVLSTHRDSGRPGYGVIYDVLTNTTTTIYFAGAGTPDWHAAAVSPQANYVFIGNSLYMIIKRDVQARTPRVRFTGTLIREMPYQPLNTPIIFEPPGLDALFFSGKLLVKRIYVEPTPVDLVVDPDIVYGKLTRMLNKDLISKSIFLVEHSEIPVLEIWSGEVIRDILETHGVRDYENYVAQLSSIKLTPPPYFWEGNAYYGTIIHIPLTQPLAIYSEMRLELSTIIHTSTLLYDKDKRALGVLGLPVQIGGGIGISSYTYSKIANTILAKWATQRAAIEAGKVAGLVTSQSISKIAGVVGVAIAVWGGIDAALIKWGGIGEIDVQSWIIIAPTAIDKYGRKFSAIRIYLPLEESRNIQLYYNIIQEYFIKLGYLDIGKEAYFIGNTWSDYKRILEGGFTPPPPDLYDMIKNTVLLHGVSIEDVVVKGVDVLVVTRIRAKETFWEWFFGLGGVSAETITLIGTSQIQVKGVLRAGTITDPSHIASILKKIYVNNAPVELKPGSEGAYGEFNIQLGTPKLIFKFNTQIPGYYGDLRLEITTTVKSQFRELDTYGYTTTLNYNWSNTLIRLARIELVDMPHPMIMCERTFIYEYGNFTHDLTKYFNLTSVIDDPISPTGKLYYYITTSTVIFDPANGGILQPGKKYIINYYYKTPPDISIIVYLNGTQVTSTLPHHVTVVLNNSAPPQVVKYSLDIKIKYFEGVVEKTLRERQVHRVITTRNYTVSYDVHDIAQYIYEALEYMKTTNKTVFVEFTGRIIEAKYNYFKHNDEYRVIYYPPVAIPPPIPIGNFTVTIRVYEYREYKWQPSINTLVEIYKGFTTEGVLIYSSRTSEAGIVELILEQGTYTFKASKPGFLDYTATLTIISNTIVNLYLAPVEKPINITPTPTNITVHFYVYNAASGVGISGATIRATLIEPYNSTYYNTTFTNITDSYGYSKLVLPIGKYRVDVSAIGFIDYTGYYVFDSDDAIVNIPLTPIGVAPPTHYTLTIRVLYSDKKPYEGAEVRVIGDTLNITLKTDSHGTCIFILPANVEYNVTVIVVEQLYNKSYVESRKIVLTSDTLLVFTIPWSSPQPPIIIDTKYYYWLGVQVLWANNLPFQNAVISVYNYTTGELIETITSGTGIAWFILPAFQLYIVNVTAINPYNVSLVFTDTYIVNLTENKVLTIKVPWLPEEPVLSQQYRVIIYAYNVLNGVGVADVDIIIRRGDMLWTSKTNSTGYAELYIPYTGYYNITGIHRDYMAVWREIIIVENNTLVNLPLTPILVNITPPVNNTLPPVIINNTAHYWLSIQVLWSDGYPFHGANITVYDSATGAMIATGLTNGTGIIHFLIKANTTIKYTVNATNPLDPTKTYYTERIINMTQHYYFVHVVPWTSQYFTPEVAVTSVELIIHRGQGYFYGNISHMVLFSIWTNIEQNITVFIGLYNATGETPVLINSKTVNLTLKLGVNVFMEWISINASEGGYFTVFINITSYTNDTVLENNALWSKRVYLKPFTDFYVIILWRPIRVKQSWTILPGDIVEVDIGVYIPVNTTHIPAIFKYNIGALNITHKTIDIIKGVHEELKTHYSGIMWRNTTISIPWTSKIYINASISHPWEDVGLNNELYVEIPVDPDIELKIEDYTRITNEGGEIRVIVILKSNIEAEKKALCWVTIEDNTTNKILSRIELTIEPHVKIEIKTKAPENPAAFWIIRQPSTIHNINIRLSGFDTYLENNYADISVTVLSNQWIAVTLGVVVIIGVIVAIKALTHTILVEINSHRKFIRRKFLTHK